MFGWILTDWLFQRVMCRHLVWWWCTWPVSINQLTTWMYKSWNYKLKLTSEVIFFLLFCWDMYWYSEICLFIAKMGVVVCRIFQDLNVLHVFPRYFPHGLLVIIWKILYWYQSYIHFIKEKRNWLVLENVLHQVLWSKHGSWDLATWSNLHFTI